MSRMDQPLYNPDRSNKEDYAETQNREAHNWKPHTSDS